MKKSKMTLKKGFEKIQGDCEDIYPCDCHHCPKGVHCRHVDNEEGDCVKEECPKIKK